MKAPERWDFLARLLVVLTAGQRHEPIALEAVLGASPPSASGQGHSAKRPPPLPCEAPAQRRTQDGHDAHDLVSLQALERKRIRAIGLL